MMILSTGLMTLVAFHAVAWAALMLTVNRLRDRKFAALAARRGGRND